MTTMIGAGVVELILPKTEIGSLATGDGERERGSRTRVTVDGGAQLEFDRRWVRKEFNEQEITESGSKLLSRRSRKN